MSIRPHALFAATYAAVLAILIGSSCFAEPTFRTFGTLPQEANDSICFRTFVPISTAKTHTNICFKTFSESTEKLTQEVAKKRTLPKATLITPTFPCVPCELWKRRIKDLPFEVNVVKRRTSPIRDAQGRYLFPVFEYRENGIIKRYQGSVDGFLQSRRRQLSLK